MPTIKANHHTQPRSAGFSLIETMVALVIVAVGLAALLGLHNTQQMQQADAKARAEATVLASAKLQELESYLTANDPRLDIDIYGPETVAGQATTFNRAWEVTGDATCISPCLRVASVEVTWKDRDDIARTVQVQSEIMLRRPEEEVEALLMIASAAATGSGGNLWASAARREDDDDDDEEGDDNDDNAEEDTEEDDSEDDNSEEDDDAVPLFNDEDDSEDGSEDGSDDSTATLAACGCEYRSSKGGQYSLTSSGGSCCSVSGCEDEGPSSPKNKDTWTYACEVED